MATRIIAALAGALLVGASGVSARVLMDPQPTTANCTWKYYNQPLDHFAGSTSDAFVLQQRVCFYDDFVPQSSKPRMIFLYVGNESPVDVYINNTGLMWENGAALEATLVFAEHRYEGQSVPKVLDGTRDCLAYLSSKQALADYALLIVTMQLEDRFKDVPVVVTGGSYGGMLAAWMRARYPHLVLGAIAGSAPIFGLPTFAAGRPAGLTLDGSAAVISRSLTSNGGAGMTNNNCLDNLKAAWVLMQYAIDSLEGGSQLVKDKLALCGAPPKPKSDEAAYLLLWLQSAYFLLAEGNYPFASDYITGSIGGRADGTGYKLPPWPMTVACQKLQEDFGVEFASAAKKTHVGGEAHRTTTKYDASDAEVKQVAASGFNVTFDSKAPSRFTLAVEADKIVSAIGGDEPMSQQRLGELLEGVKHAADVWYNVTENVKCYEWRDDIPSESSLKKKPLLAQARREEMRRAMASSPKIGLKSGPQKKEKQGSVLKRQQEFLDSERICQYNNPKFPNNTVPSAFSWDPLVCNDQLYIINTDARGYGLRDLYWPPLGPLTTKEAYGNPPLSLLDETTMWPTQCAQDTAAEQHLYGLTNRSDPYGQELYSYYGNVLTASNVVYSNGLLDPWAAGGFFVPALTPTEKFEGKVVNKVAGLSNVYTVLIERGGHHLDLMFSTDQDPPEVVVARQFEVSEMQRWVASYWAARRGLGPRKDTGVEQGVKLIID
mmetsp:Transcript_28250/g.68021  ORF Transcript_28250/g.68021 Transcript_28250/m.68021 type:complete len:717 (+) Transcript_28250:59-2209(+)|eukprot:CAMPEP_0181092008 /NCGR_PEP_ID=MMETSP1071-20121207/8697_1 /TAXON_ID=35127 /ORGANISM="Thalassiosira sp., Strain NH16" /LENGTH=716 /DNA_ID=CAMNT_0023174175 /DNA_START=34 /DNA_END=2184 /DNA_ORIENTATION=-